MFGISNRPRRGSILLDWTSRSAARQWVRDVCGRISRLRVIDAVDDVATAAIAEHPTVLMAQIVVPFAENSSPDHHTVPCELLAAFELEQRKADGGLAIAAQPTPCGERSVYCVSIGSHPREGLLFVVVNTAHVDPLLLAVSATIATSVALNRSRLRSQQRLRDLKQASHDISHEISKLRTDIAVSREVGKSGTLRWDVSGDGPAEWSDEVYQVFGFDKEQDRPAIDLILSRIHRDDIDEVRARLEEAISGQAVCQVRYRIVRRDGSLRHLLSVFRAERAAARTWTGIFIDLTERYEAGEAVGSAHSRLTSMSQLMTVGQLGVSIAHELNQPLTSMVANAGATLRWSEKRPLEQAKVLTGLNAIVSEAGRASGFVKGLRSLAKKSEPRLEVVDLDDAVAEVLPLIAQEMVSRSTKIRPQLGASGAIVKADRVQLQQIVLALVLHAVSSPQIGGEESVISLSTSREDNAVRINVQYQGLELKEVIFQDQIWSGHTPSEIGLSVFKSIVKAHEGKYEVRRLTNGTEISVVLPVSAAQGAVEMRTA